MPAVGGPVEEYTYDGRTFAVAQDAEAQVKLGGFENEVQLNGNGTGRIIKSRMAWKVDGLNTEIDQDRGDQEFLQERADGKTFRAFSITFASGNTYQGSAILTGEFQASSQSATAPATFEGPGKLTKQ